MLTHDCARLSSWRPVRRGCPRETLPGQGGMRCPAGWLVTTPPGGSGNPPSATTSGRDKRVYARLCRASEFADGEAQLHHPARDRLPINRRSGAPRGGHPRRADCVSGSARDARRALSPCGPALLAREGVAIHPERLSALRLPHVREGIGKARRVIASREG